MCTHVPAGLCKLLKVLVRDPQIEKHLGFTQSLHTDFSCFSPCGSGSPTAPGLLLYTLIPYLFFKHLSHLFEQDLYGNLI